MSLDRFLLGNQSINKVIQLPCIRENKLQASLLNTDFPTCTFHLESSNTLTSDLGYHTALYISLFIGDIIGEAPIPLPQGQRSHNQTRLHNLD